jgi:hypothetical protein
MEACPDNSNGLFGPRVNPNCRSFDFTIYFEDVFFALVPAAIFLAGVLASCISLWKQPHVVKASKSVALKMVGSCAVERGE